MTRHNATRVWILLLFVAAGCAACARLTPPVPTPITVQLSWTHQAQFAGFCRAEQQGYYAAEGLAVSLVEGGANIVPLERVEGGAAQFAVTTADQVLMARGDGRPVQAIAAVFRRSPRVYVSLAASGITRPQDFVGKNIAVSAPIRPQFVAMMGRCGVTPAQYTMVDVTPDLTQLTSGTVDVRAVFLTNEVLTLKAAGYPLNIIYPDDYGIHTYNDVIVASDALIAERPELVQRFLRATLEGWTYAVENPAAIGPLVVKLNPKADGALEIAKMTAGLPLVNTGEDHVGWMKAGIWSGMEAMLREQGVLSRPLDVTQAYTQRFLNEIFGK